MTNGKWTEDSIALALATSIFPWRRYVVVPNVSWGLLPHEADVVVLSEAGWLSEIEIKISVADFRADAKKHKHALAKHYGEAPLIRSFYYAMPRTVWGRCRLDDLPTGAGLILVGDRFSGDSLAAEVKHEPTPNPGARKLTEAERLQLVRLGYIRYWCRQEAGERLLVAAQRELEVALAMREVANG